jgi:transcriptional regulator with XRE-family HTH domain
MIIFPEIAKLMSMKKMYQKDIAKLIGVTPQHAGRILSGKAEFKRSDMVKIKAHFADVAPDISMDNLFAIFLG